MHEYLCRLEHPHAQMYHLEHLDSINRHLLERLFGLVGRMTRLCDGDLAPFFVGGDLDFVSWSYPDFQIEIDDSLGYPDPAAL